MTSAIPTVLFEPKCISLKKILCNVSCLINIEMGLSSHLRYNVSTNINAFSLKKSSSFLVFNDQVKTNS